MLCSLAWAVPGCLFVSKLGREENQTYSLPVQLAQPDFIMNCRCNILLISGLQRLSKNREQDQMVESKRADWVRRKGRNNQALWSKALLIYHDVIVSDFVCKNYSWYQYFALEIDESEVKLEKWCSQNIFLEWGWISSTCSLRTHDLPNPAMKMPSGAVTAELTEFMLNY